MEDLASPIVTAKPTRGREMKTTTIPTNVFDVRKKSRKKSAKEKSQDGKVEHYHEGYVEGKLYLVPDTNLEAMKDMINFKMRPKKSTRYRHQTSFEVSDYDRLHGKLGGMISKLDNIKDLHTGRNKEHKKSEPDEEEEQTEPEEFYREESESESLESDMKSDVESRYEEKSEVESQVTESSEDREPKQELPTREQRRTPEDEKESGVYYRRFLVSGHLKKDQKPIYIIQEYNGEPDLFKNQKADFFSKQNNGNVDVLISGKFYKESMLEESNGSPVALKTKPEKIKIEKGKSSIYDNYFEKIYNMANVDISLRGEFIKSELNKMTPLLTLGLKKRRSNEKPLQSPNYGRNIYNKNASPTTVLIYEPKYRSPFSKDLESIETEDSDESDTDDNPQTKDLINGESSTETESSVTDDDLHQNAKNNFSGSDPSKHFTGTKKTHELHHKQPNHPKQTINDQNEVNHKDSADNLEAVGQNLKRKRSRHREKKSPEEGVMNMIRESSVFKTLFGNKTSKDNSEIKRKPKKVKVKNSNQTIQNSQETPSTKRKVSRSRKENSSKVKSTTILPNKNRTHKKVMEHKKA